MPIISTDFKIRPKHNWYSKIIRKFYKIRVDMTKPRNPIADKDIREKAESQGRLVIQIPYGGLGDHLSYSSLPELLLKQKNIKTLFSRKSVFSSKPIMDFVWKMNPYVEFTDEHGWFIHQPNLKGFLTLDEYLQTLFGLSGEGLPRVYYQPNLIEGLRGKTVIDPSFGPSGKANGYFEPAFHHAYIEYLRQKVGDFVLIAHRHQKKLNVLEKKLRKALDPPIYEVATIEALADVLFSAAARYLMYSGSASLAAALRLESTVLCNRKSSPHFQYGVNEYIGLIGNRVCTFKRFADEEAL